MFGRKFTDCDDTRGLHSTPLDSQSTFKHGGGGGGGGKAVGPKCSIEFWAPETPTIRIRAVPKRSHRLHHTTINCCRSNPCTNGLSRHRPVALCRKDDRFSVQPKCLKAPLFRPSKLAFTKRTVDGAIAAARELHRCLSDECNGLVLRGGDRFSSFKSNSAAAAAAAAEKSRLDWLCNASNSNDDDDDDPCKFLNWRDYDPVPIRTRSSDCRRVGARSSPSVWRPSSFKGAPAYKRDFCSDATSRFRTAAASKEPLRCPGLGRLERRLSCARSLTVREPTTDADHFWNQLWDNIQPAEEDIKNESAETIRQIAGQIIQDFICKIKLDLEREQHENTEGTRRVGKERKQPGDGKGKATSPAGEKGESSLSLPITLSGHKPKPDVVRIHPKSDKGKEPKDKGKPEHPVVPVVAAGVADKGKESEDETDKSSDSASDDGEGSGTSTDDAKRSDKKAPDDEDVKTADKETTDEDQPKPTGAQKKATADDSKEQSTSGGSGSESSTSARTTSTESSGHRPHDSKRKKKADVRQHVLLRQQQQQQPVMQTGKQSMFYIEKTETIKFHSAPPSSVHPKDDSAASSKSSSGGHQSDGEGSDGGGGGGGGKEHPSKADSDQQQATKSAEQHKKAGDMVKATSDKRKQLTKHESDRTDDKQQQQQQQQHGVLQDLAIDPEAEETLKSFANDIVQSLYTAIQYKLRSLIRDSSDDKMRDEIMERGEFELKNHILPTFIEHIVWIIKKEFSEQTEVQLKHAMEHDPGRYVDTVVTNAVMKTHNNPKAKSPVLKAFVVMSNCKSAGKRAL